MGSGTRGTARRLSGRWALTLALSLGVLSVGVPPAHTEDINEQVAEADDDLARADEKVAAAIDQLTDARQKLPAARRELAQAQADLTRAQERKARADVKVAKAVAAVAQAEQEIAKLQQQIAFLQNQIGQMARSVYTQGGEVSEIEVLLASSTPSDFASRLQSLRTIAAGNNHTLADLTSAKDQLDARLVQLNELEQQAEDARKEALKEVEAATEAKARADAAKAKVDELVAARASALRDAKSRRAAVKKQYDKLKAEQERMAAMARAAAARAASGQGMAGVPGSIGPGGLLWPTPGAGVSGNVGPRIHPVYGYRSCHTGADISAGYGTAIHATATGVVVSTQSGGPYGNHILVQHAQGLSSMYAHLSRFAANPGQRVSRGDVIGYVGSTGWSTGPHLHFEIHVNGTPYDPMGWFGGSKRPVAC